MKQLDLVIAGFGGQGILSAGKLLAYAGMLEGKHVSWLPSYGPEMRGGTANCSIVISDEPIGSPIIDYPNALIAMNGPSLEKFEKKIVKGGFIITNSSLVEGRSMRTDVEFIGVPATEMASDMGNLTYANIIILGKLLGKTGIVKKESFEAALKKVLPEKKHYMIPDEMKALVMGHDI
ncbi:2-oxoglutarate ferredoxin oxidoreductase subunit gamma [Ruminiclostridium sufflavum DSM 19573]|uniref:2-oxoglutarate ferredoxin oxidoreductase subunit gamma n=1 Tax=Ruminiclostridium sufflavum DSM 19573 TaxID=1121337 RepID=A0A318XNT7_9FIRM|nr:2-oxoacid:acceptor oxidoreductase family protein [Ruminiclostridium sufflavum]PYG88581.1 2-oxoglutarate ferredoxin oxidoreductase subunit gamma [Ruminiclostridium sufflavum DSM 19573]